MPINHHRPARLGSVPVDLWQRQRLGHIDRIKIMEAARRLERETYRRGSGRHGGDLRETGLKVLWALLFRGWGRAGACDPSLAQVAEAARIARSTVQEAIKRIEAAGIMLHVMRGSVVGARFVQVTSAYLFRAPCRWSDTGNRSASDSELKEKALEEVEQAPLPPIPESARAALAEKWGLPYLQPAQPA